MDLDLGPQDNDGIHWIPSTMHSTRQVFLWIYDTIQKTISCGYAWLSQGSHRQSLSMLSDCLNVEIQNLGEPNPRFYISVQIQDPWNVDPLDLHSMDSIDGSQIYPIHDIDPRSISWIGPGVGPIPWIQIYFVDLYHGMDSYPGIHCRIQRSTKQIFRYYNGSRSQDYHWILGDRSMIWIQDLRSRFQIHVSQILSLGPIVDPRIIGSRIIDPRYYNPRAISQILVLWIIDPQDQNNDIGPIPWNIDLQSRSIFHGMDSIYRVQSVDLYSRPQRQILGLQDLGSQILDPIILGLYHRSQDLYHGSQIHDIDPRIYDIVLGYRIQDL